MGSAELAAQEVRQRASSASLQRALALSAAIQRALHGDHAEAAKAILDKIHTGLTRIDLYPESAWAAEDIMSVQEADVMFKQAHLGLLVVVETARCARQVLSRWPDPLVGHAFTAGDRINDYFAALPPLDPAPDDIGRKVINRALAADTEVLEYPELDGLDDDQLFVVWLAVVYWFAIKTVALNQWAAAATATTEPSRRPSGPPADAV